MICYDVLWYALHNRPLKRIQSFAKNTSLLTIKRNLSFCSKVKHCWKETLQKAQRKPSKLQESLFCCTCKAHRRRHKVHLVSLPLSYQVLWKKKNQIRHQVVHCCLHLNFNYNNKNCEYDWGVPLFVTLCCKFSKFNIMDTTESQSYMFISRASIFGTVLRAWLSIYLERKNCITCIIEQIHYFVNTNNLKIHQNKTK